MPKSTSFDNALLLQIFQGTAITGLTQNNASPVTSLYVSLHTADPSSGNQSTSEVGYAGYARTATARTSSGWTISGSTVNPAATISFPACTSGSATASYFGIGVASSGATVLLYSGTVSPTISISSGTTPQLSTSSTVTEA